MKKEYLYHYTSVETLAYILKYKTFRFLRLNLVDDKEESLTQDYGDLGRFCYVSCWTESNEESIPMWKMYSNDMKGVRIKLPKYPFKEHVIKNTTINYNQETKIKQVTENGDSKSYVDFTLFSSLGYSCVIEKETFLREIIYTDDKNLLFPVVQSINDDTTTIDFKNVGIYKSKGWAFQQEIRYKFNIAPWNYEETMLLTPQVHSELLKRLEDPTCIPENFIDFQLDEDKFSDMEVMLGPKTTDAEKIIVKSLLESFNPKASLKASVLQIRH